MAQRLRNFWQRISDGAALQDMWAQFHAEARSSYQFYSKEVDSTRREGESRGKRMGRVVRGLFWAMMMKLTPARRVLLLIALILLVLPNVRVNRGDAEIDTGSLKGLADVILVALLALELADRVTMKRDLEIAREIQSWAHALASAQRGGG
jgi:sigma-B regulation protein RsbU (phosphoserine phosphatase)